MEERVAHQRYTGCGAPVTGDEAAGRRRNRPGGRLGGRGGRGGRGRRWRCTCRDRRSRGLEWATVMRHFFGFGLPALPIPRLAIGMHAAPPGRLLVALPCAPQALAPCLVSTRLGAVPMPAIAHRAEVDREVTSIAEETAAVGARWFHSRSWPGHDPPNLVILTPAGDSSSGPEREVAQARHSWPPPACLTHPSSPSQAQTGAGPRPPAGMTSPARTIWPLSFRSPESRAFQPPFTRS